MSSHRSDDESYLDPSGDDTPPAGLWRDSDPRFDDRQLCRNLDPCAVYDDSPEAMGRVTTPLGDLRFANVFGTPVEMARQLGRASRGEVRDGALEFLNRFTDDIVELLAPAPLVRAGSWALDRWLTRRLEGTIPAGLLDSWHAYGEGMGFDTDAVVRGQLLWDIWALLACAPLDRVRRVAGSARRHSPLLGSFSMVLPTEVAGPLHLRWLDNAAVGRWDRRASAVFFHPDQGLGYVLVSSLGFFAGLPCGMNAAGLTVSVEPSSGGDVDWEGTVVSAPIHTILSQAHTIEEAASLLREHPSLAPWRYVFTEGNTGRSAVFETGGTVEQCRSTDTGAFALGSFDGEPTAGASARIGHWHHTRRRLVEGFVDDWTAPKDDVVYSTLRDLVDPDEQTGGGSSFPLAAPSNVSAVLFEPAARRLWVAVGRCPVGRRWFVPLSLRFSSGSSEGSLDGRVRPIKPAGDWENQKAGRAVDHLRHAHRLELAGESPRRILIPLEHALALDPADPDLHILAGLMALKAGRAPRAEGAFRKAIDRLDDPPRRTEVQLYLGWALDVQGRHKKARRLYSQLARSRDTDPAVRRRASRARKKRFEPDDIERFDVDFFLATVFEACS